MRSNLKLSLNESIQKNWVHTPMNTVTDLFDIDNFLFDFLLIASALVLNFLFFDILYLHYFYDISMKKVI